MNPTQSLTLIHKLLVQNMYEIKYRTIRNGINVMSQEDVLTFYTKPAKLIQQALDIVE